MSNSQLIQKTKRRRVVVTKRWTESEEILILNYLVESIPKNKQFEKPNAVSFYKTMTDELGLVVSATSQTMNKVKNLRSSYVKAVDWKSHTGEGVEQGTIDEYVKRICPHFDILDEIFGHKTNIVPPYIYESGVKELELNSNDSHLDYEFLDEANLYGHNNDGQRVIDQETFRLVDKENIAENAEILICDDLEEYFAFPPERNELPSSSDSSQARFKRILGTVPPKSSSTSQETPPNSQYVVGLDDEKDEDFPFPPDRYKSPSSSDSSLASFKRILGTVQPKSSSASQQKSQSNLQHVSRYKKRLLTSPVVEQDKSFPRNSSSILAEAQQKRAEAIFGRNDIDKARAENDKLFKLEEVALAKDKFMFDKEVRQSEIDLRKIEIELREKEIQSRERIEMYRIEIEARNNLEIAKLRSINYDR